MEKASGVNLEKTSGVGVPKAVRRCIQPVLTAPAAALVPNCSDPVVPLVPSVTWRGGSCCMGNSLSSILHCPGLHPTTPHTNIHRTTPGEDTPASPSASTQHGERQLPVLSHCSIGVERRRQGSFSSVGEVFKSHWTATARPKLGSPQSVRCCPATVCLPYWVQGD